MIRRSQLLWFRIFSVVLILAFLLPSTPIQAQAAGPFTISGTISLANAAASISFNDGVTDWPATIAGDGLSYTISGFADDATGTITATPAAGYTLAPDGGVITIASPIASNLPGQDFTGTLNTYNISGTVKTTGGVAIEGVTVTLGAYSDDTDSLGEYTITAVPYGSTGDLTASKTGYTFNGPFTLTAVTDNLVAQDFTGTLNTYTISGTVKTVGGVAIEGVTVTLGAYSDATDALGEYSIQSIPYGTTGDLTAAKTGFSFSGPITLPILTVNLTAQDFTEEENAPPFTPMAESATPFSLGTYDADDSNITYSGTDWTVDASGALTSTQNATAQWQFTLANPGVMAFKYTKADGYGTAQIQFDLDAPETNLDMSNEISGNTWISRTLDAGTHTVTITNLNGLPVHLIQIGIAEVLTAGIYDDDNLSILKFGTWASRAFDGIAYGDSAIESSDGELIIVFEQVDQGGSTAFPLISDPGEHKEGRYQLDENNRREINDDFTETIAFTIEPGVTLPGRHTLVIKTFTGSLRFDTFEFTDVGQFVSCAAQTSIDETECDALLAFYSSTDGNNWSDKTGWLTLENPCFWGGVSCENSHVDYLDLSYNNLVGTIPDEIGDLPYLTGLSLSNNQLTGTIPTIIGSMTHLTSIYISENQLTGEIPAEIWTLSSLRSLGLEANELTGSIPTSISALVNLGYLTLSNNNFSGDIPSEIGTLSDLQSLDLSNNAFTGNIPSINGMTSLSYIDFSENHLSGSLPAFDAMPALYTLMVDDNILTGDIPATITLLSNLAGDTGLTLEYNCLNTPTDQTLVDFLTAKDPLWNSDQTTNCPATTWTISGSITPANVITSISFNDGTTDFPGVIAGDGLSYTISSVPDGSAGKLYAAPADGYSLSPGRVYPGISVTQNLTGKDFSGALYTAWESCATQSDIPETECDALVALYNSTDGANWTQNTGWLQINQPCSWDLVGCESGHVTELNLNGNGLTGTIPVEIGDLPELNLLYLYSNSLSGSIPAEIGNLSNLISISLSGNQLTNSIPTSIGNLINLQTLHLGGNQLTGEIPSEIGSLTSLEELFLYFNQLTGTIPSEITTLPNLVVLELENNELSGPIPSTIGNLTGLRSLTLNDNHLTGEIPSSITQLTNSFSQFDIYNNCLTSTNQTVIDFLDVKSPTWNSDQTTNCPVYTISGSVGVFGGGATISFTGGTPVTADGSGNYTITVPYNWSGTVTPSKTGFSFSPPSKNFAGVQANISGEDFIGQLAVIIDPTETPTSTATSTNTPTATSTVTSTAPFAGPGTYDDTSPWVQYSGVWVTLGLDGPYNSTSHYTTDQGASTSLRFNGTSITYKYPTYYNRGHAVISIDGTPVATVSLYSSGLVWQKTWIKDDLAPGNHTITVTRQDGVIDLDAFIVGRTEAPIVTAGTYDDRDGVLTYTGTWYNDFNGPGPYANTNSYTYREGAASSLRFNGTTVSFLYTGMSNRGSMDVYIDDVWQERINQFSLVTTWQKQSPNYTVDSGEHTLKLVNHSNSPVDVDAFIVGGTSAPTNTPTITPTASDTPTVTNTTFPSNTPTITQTSVSSPIGTPVPSGSTVDDTDSRIIYAGSWSTIQTSGPYNSTSHFTSQTGASASLSFTGTQVSYVYPRYIDRGTARITIDGVFHADISLHSWLGPYWQNVWTSGLLNDGTHTIKVEALGNGIVDVDAFIVNGVPSSTYVPAGIYDDRDPNMVYFGRWYPYNIDGPFNDTINYTDKDNVNVSLSFNGSRLWVVFTGTTNRGIADVYIDGALRGVINMYNAEFAWGQTWESPDLGPAENHVIKIVRRSNQPGMYIDIDAIVVE